MQWSNCRVAALKTVLFIVFLGQFAENETNEINFREIP